MKRVVGIGGIFFKAHDPTALRAWYRRHLGMDVQEWGGVRFHWHSPDQPDLNEESEYGRFGWVMDPDGNRIELWEPPPGRTAG